MSTAYNYKEGFWIELFGNAEAECKSFYNWTAKFYGELIATGTEANQVKAAIQAENACDAYTPNPYPFDINLLEDGTVLTKDGEIVGTWKVDETDALYLFTPEGADKHTLTSPFRGLLCDKIKEWQNGSSVIDSVE